MFGGTSALLLVILTSAIALFGLHLRKMPKRRN